MVDLAEIRRTAGFSWITQAERELYGRSFPGLEIVKDIRKFEVAWTDGAPPQSLNASFRLQKVHDAECARRGILLYEIYVQRGQYRAVVAWFDEHGPGYWVSVFKKQGNAQSRSSLRSAGERAVRLWRETNE